MNEYFDVLDENGNPIGKISPKTEVHNKGYWHRTVHIWIINNNNEILLQRRSKNKKRHPNILTISCEGHIQAGESSINGAIREIDEELGLKVNSDELTFIKTIKHSECRKPDYYNNEFKDFYILKTNTSINEMSFQKEEISEIMFVDFDKLKQLINTDDVIIRNYSFQILEDYYR